MDKLVAIKPMMGQRLEGVSRMCLLYEKIRLSWKRQVRYSKTWASENSLVACVRLKNKGSKDVCF